MLPQYQMNPINDFYFRNSVPQFNQQFPPQTPPQNNHQVVTRFVTSVDEARAAMIDGLSTNIFLDSGSGKIYLKRLNNNGTSDFYTYIIEEQKPQDNRDPMAEINSRLANIEAFLGGMANGSKSVPVNADGGQSVAVTSTAVAESNEPNGTAEPAGFPKNAGNDKWQKRR